jgi:hypothetical protein
MAKAATGRGPEFDGPKPRDPGGGEAWIQANRGRTRYAVAHEADGLPRLASARITGGNHVVTLIDGDLGDGPSFFAAADAIADYVARIKEEADAARSALDLAERRLAAVAGFEGA